MTDPTRTFSPHTGIFNEVYARSLEYPATAQPFDPFNDGRALPSVPTIKIRPSHFRISHEKDVTIRGFRTLLDTNGLFYNDEFLAGTSTTTDIINKISSHLNEDVGEFRAEENSIKFENRPVRIVEEPVLVLNSDEPSNYGSWLYRIIPKLIDARRLGVNRLFLFCNSPWMDDLLALSMEDFKVIRHSPSYDYLLNEAFVPSLRNRGVSFDQGTKDFYHETALRLGREKGADRIYLARRSDKRRISNELKLESILEDHGFRCVEPARMSVRDQVAAIRDAKIIVCCGGSGLFNLVFAVNAEFVINIEPNKTWVSAHGSLLSTLVKNYSVLFGEQCEAGGPHGDWSVDVDRVKEILRII